MLREAARREFIAIITLDGLSEAALHTHCLALVFVCKYDASHHTHTHTYSYA